MYQEILNQLKAKFTGVSENILVRIATKLAQTNTTAEQAKATVEAYTLQQVIDGYADSRATEATQTAVSNYEKKHGLKDGVKVEAVTTLTGGAPVTNPTPTTQPTGG